MSRIDSQRYSDNISGFLYQVIGPRIFILIQLNGTSICKIKDKKYLVIFESSSWLKKRKH